MILNISGYTLPFFVSNASQTKPFEFWINNIPIVEGTNSIDATAQDDEGMDDLTPAMNTFYSPMEAEARAKIEEILDAWGGTYFKDETLSFNANSNPLCQHPEGTLLQIPLDYVVLDDGKFSTINYTSFSDDLPSALNNYDDLRNCRDSKGDLQMSRLPLDEVESRVKTFKDNGFMN